jgi:hypothetical protein
MNSNLKISVAPSDVDSSSEEVTDIILLNSDDANMTTFSEIPLEFESSNSSISTADSTDDTTKIEAPLPMLTDVAEETIYETEFFEESLQLEDSILKESRNSLVQEHNDISNILMETIVPESNEYPVENDIYAESTEIDILAKEMEEEEEEETKGAEEDDDADFLDSEILETVDENEIADFDANGKIEANLISNDNGDGILIAAPVSASNPSANDLSNLITVSNNTNLVSNLLGNATLDNLTAVAEETNNIEFLANPKSTVYTNLSNVFQINAIGNKISTLQPITVQSAPKLVPISIAPANAIKRSTAIPIGPASPNVSRLNLFRNVTTCTP